MAIYIQPDTSPTLTNPSQHYLAHSSIQREKPPIFLFTTEEGKRCAEQKRFHLRQAAHSYRVLKTSVTKITPAVVRYYRRNWGTSLQTQA